MHTTRLWFTQYHTSFTIETQFLKNCHTILSFCWNFAYANFITNYLNWFFAFNNTTEREKKKQIVKVNNKVNNNKVNIFFSSSFKWEKNNDVKNVIKRNRNKDEVKMEISIVEKKSERRYEWRSLCAFEFAVCPAFVFCENFYIIATVIYLAEWLYVFHYRSTGNYCHTKYDRQLLCWKPGTITIHF